MIASDVATKVLATVMTSSPATNAERLQRDEQRIGSVRKAEAMIDAAILREGLLERLDVRAADEGGLLEHGGDRGVDLGLDGLVLRLQIYERNVHRGVHNLHRLVPRNIQCGITH